LMRRSICAALRLSAPLPHMPITPMRSRSTNGRVPKIVDGGAEVLDEDVGGRDVARLPAAEAVERRVEGESDEPGGDPDPEPVLIRDRRPCDDLVEVEDVVV